MDQVIETRRALAAKYAAKYSLSTELVCAVIEQESSWCQWSYRYEPGFYNHYILPLNLEEQVGRFRATSWGLMQIMGQTAREFGFIGQFMSELCDPDVGLDFGCKKLKKCIDDSGGDEALGLLKWNGGSNTEYPQQVLNRKARYTIQGG
jgi:soluble lytic murein transglycosylase-like protein